ncbi:MAG: c-type cytochrome [Phycisphaerae bacterium]
MTRCAGSLFTVTLLAFMAGCPTMDPGGSGDDQCNPACAAGETCENGVCVAGEVPDDTCDPACAAGETCENGVCVAQPPADTCDPACAADETCENGVCVANTPPAGGGDAAAGEAFYTNNTCAACHLADATGSIGPNIVGKGAARVLEVLTVAGAHGIGPNLPDTTQQDADDVSAFLGSL